MDAGRGNSVVRKRVADHAAGHGWVRASGCIVVNGVEPSESVESLRKIALLLCRRGYGQQRLVWASLTGPFVNRKPKRSVLDQLAAGAGAKFISLE